MASKVAARTSYIPEPVMCGSSRTHLMRLPGSSTGAAKPLAAMNLAVLREAEGRWWAVGCACGAGCAVVGNQWPVIGGKAETVKAEN